MVYIPASLKSFMQVSWFKEEFTLYTRIVLTPSDFKIGTSRVQASPLAKGSTNVDGSPKGLLGSATTSPTKEDEELQRRVRVSEDTLFLVGDTFDIEPAIAVVKVSAHPSDF